MLSQQQFIEGSPLITAINDYDTDQIKLLLKNGADINDPNVLVAAVQKSLEIVNLLLNFEDGSIDVNVTDKFKRTPLYYCIARRFTIHLVDCSKSIISFCSLSDQHDTMATIELLLKRGADPNIGLDVYFPLHTAVLKDDSKLVKLLVKHNVDVNCLDSEGNTALHYAVVAKPEILDFILASNPNVNIANIDGRTPLHFAAVDENWHACEKLIAKNCNINSVDGSGSTALHLLSSQCENIKSITTLLKNKADVNMKNQWGLTPLHELATNSTFDNCRVNVNDIVEIITTFLSCGADIEAIDDDRKTPLAIACRNHCTRVTKALLHCRADINFKCFNDGTSLLHLVTEHLKVEIFTILLKYGADINSICNKYKTALEYLKEQIEKLNSETEHINVRRHKAIQCSRIYKIIREHVIKLQCAKLYVNTKNIHLVYNYEFHSVINRVMTRYNLGDTIDITEITEIENRCNQEIKMIKGIENGILYNFLNKNIHDLVKFIRDEQIYREFYMQLDYFEHIFPEYGNIIKCRFHNAEDLSKILDYAKDNIVSLLFRELPLLCVDKIIRYLDLTDLKACLKAME